jgi:hypothetical protein
MKPIDRPISTRVGTTNRSTDRCAYMCTYTHTHTYIYIHIYTTNPYTHTHTNSTRRQDRFVARPISRLFGNKGIIFSNGNEWAVRACLFVCVCVCVCVCLLGGCVCVHMRGRLFGWVTVDRPRTTAFFRTRSRRTNEQQRRRRRRPTHTQSIDQSNPSLDQSSINRATDLTPPFFAPSCTPHT